MERYLNALKPLVPDFQYEKTETLVEAFLAKNANKLNILLEGLCLKICYLHTYNIYIIYVYIQFNKELDDK